MIDSMIGNKMILSNRKSPQDMQSFLTKKRNSEVIDWEHITLPKLSIKERNYKSSMAMYDIERKSSL